MLLPRLAAPDPDMNIEGELSNQPTVATLNAVAVPCSPDPDMSIEEELGNQQAVETHAAVAAPCSPDPDKNKYGLVCTPVDMSSLLQSTLCEAVISVSGIEPDMHRQLRKQRAAALKSRWAN